MKGHLRIVSENIQTGESLLLVEKDNTILNQFLEQLVGLLQGNETAYVNRMQFGTGSLAPTASQTFLQRPITPVKTVTPTVTDETIVFSAYLESTEGNGFPISEAGLMCVDGTLIARTTFSARTKTSDFRFGFEWTVQMRNV